MFCFSFFILSNSIIKNTTIDKSKIEYEDIGKSIKLKCVIFDDSKKDFSVPETIESKTVTEIGEKCFLKSKISKLNIPKSINSILDFAFSETTNLKEIDLSETKIEQIRKFVFYNSSVQNVKLPKTISEILEKSFAFSKLETLDISETKVKVIHSAAFSHSSLKTIKLPETVEMIKEECFSFTRLETIDLSKTKIKTISRELFYSSVMLKQVLFPDFLEEINTKCFEKTSISSFCFKKSLNTLTTECFYGMENLETVDLSQTTFETLPKKAFMHCTSLKDVKLPGSILSIESEAFANSGIRKLFIPRSFESVSNAAFKDAKNLEFIDIKDTNLEDLSDLMFYGCSKLSSIELPINVIRIGSQCFAHSGIKNITIPKNIIDILSSAFESSDLEYANLSAASFDFLRDRVFFNCTKLEVLVLSKTITSIGSYCFAYTKFQVFVSGPVSDIGEGAFYSSLIEEANFGKSKLKTFSSYLFANASKLNSLKFPTELQQVQDYCLYNTALEHVIFPQNMNSFGKNCLSMCKKLKSVVLTNLKVNFLATGMFSNSSLESIKLNAGLLSIPDYCFQNTHLEGIELPPNIDSIGVCAFSGCTLKSIDLASTKVSEIKDSCFENSSIEQIMFNGDYTFGSRCFMNSKIKKIVMSTTKSIGKSIFESCENLASCDMSESSITEIPVRAFYNCSSLKMFKIPKQLITIDVEAFYGTSLLTIEFKQSFETFGASAFSHCKELALVDLTEADCQSISNSCFAFCSNLKEIKLSSKIATIDAFAFNCSGLECFASTDSIDTINEFAFFSCKKLKLVDLSKAKVTQISNNLFEGCNSLKEFTFSNSIELICCSAFKGTSIFAITLPPSLTTLEPSCFSDCIGTKTVDISTCHLLNEIPEHAFYSAVNLVSIKMPKELATIGKEAFFNSGIVNISLPSSLSEIGEGCFANSSVVCVDFNETSVRVIPKFCFHLCEKLRIVIFNNILETIEERAFAFSSLEDAAWPNALQTIGPYAFIATNLTFANFYNTKLKKIMNRAFAFSTVTKMTIPGTIEVINETAFDGCAISVCLLGNTFFNGTYDGIIEAYVTRNYTYEVAFGLAPKFTSVHEDGTFVRVPSPQLSMIINTLCFSVFIISVAIVGICKIRTHAKLRRNDEEALIGNTDHPLD